MAQQDRWAKFMVPTAFNGGFADARQRPHGCCAVQTSHTLRCGRNLCSEPLRFTRSVARQPAAGSVNCGEEAGTGRAHASTGLTTAFRSFDSVPTDSDQLDEP